MPNRSEETDRLMMDFLYGELSDTEAAEFEAKVAESSDLSAELDGYRRTREAFSALPEEDPPDRLTAILLHEAAKRAPAPGRKRAVTVEERPGFFATIAGWFQPVLRHPAAMSMAALVLIAGVAGALYMRGVDTAHPTAKTKAPLPATDRIVRIETEGVRPEAAGAEVDGRFALDNANADPNDPLTGFAADEAKPVAGLLDDSERRNRNAQLASATEEQALREQEKTERRVAAAPPEPKQGYSYSSELAPSKKSAGKAKAPEKPRFKADQAMANAVSGADPIATPEDEAPSAGSGSVAEGRVARSSTSRPDSTIAAGDADMLRDDRADDDGAGAPMTRGASAAPPPALSSEPTPTTGKEQKKLAESRALHGALNMVLDNPRKKSKSARCSEAAKIANDLLDKDRDYYYRKVASSKELQPCAMYVRQETERRARKRASKKAKRRAKDAPAPAEADAMEAAE